MNPRQASVNRDPVKTRNLPGSFQPRKQKALRKCTHWMPEAVLALSVCVGLPSEEAVRSRGSEHGL